MKTSSIQSTLYSPSYATLNSAVSVTGNLTQYRADGAVQPISTPSQFEKTHLNPTPHNLKLNVYAQAQQNPS